MADEYKDPNTDIMKALSKAVDAATGETGTQYEYKNPNTDVIQKLEELIEAIATSGGGGSSGHNYSTTEQVVGTWIDGKTLYEKTISTGAFSLDNLTTMHTILTDSNIDLIISITGMVMEAGIIYAVPESGLRIKYNSPNLIAEKYAGSWVVTEGYVTIRYTKTTT